MTGTPGTAPGGDEISVLEVMNALLRRWRLLVTAPVVCAALAAAVALILPPTFIANTAFVPEPEIRTQGLPGGLAGLASEFGIGAGTAGESPDFYADVLASRTLRDQLLTTRVDDPRTETPDDSVTLLEILPIRGKSEAERLERGRRKVADIVTISLRRQTGVVSVSAETRYPVLSATIANRAVELLSRFNLGTRQSRAQSRRLFVEGRLAEATEELRAAERDEQAFLERNRQFRGSPQLEFEHGRLQRRVAIKQDVLATLNRQYEEARIQQVNDTPVITVIDRAVTPERKANPKRVMITLVGFGLGVVLSGVVLLMQQIMDRARRHNPVQFEELRSRLGRTRGAD